MPSRMHAVILIVLAAVALPLSRAIRVVPEAQRIVVLRLGKIHGVLEPGLHWVIPGVDRTVPIDLNRHVADWQSLPEQELQARLCQLVQSGQLPTAI